MKKILFFLCSFSITIVTIAMSKNEQLIENSATQSSWSGLHKLQPQMLEYYRTTIAVQQQPAALSSQVSQTALPSIGLIPKSHVLATVLVVLIGTFLYTYAISLFSFTP